MSGEGTLTAGWVAVPSQCPTQAAKQPQGHSLGHLGDVFVAQGDPQVIIFIQENLLDPGLSNATGLVPGMRGGMGMSQGCWGHTQPPHCWV